MSREQLRTLGDYDIVKQIGHGALGSVYLAEHRFMKRPYALKVLPEELASDRAFVQRFQDEVKGLATLEHPNIVKIHNVSYAEGRYFLVSDCIVDQFGETCNLAQYLASLDRGLPENELVSILDQVASALDYAHSRQVGGQEIAHGGLKLTNILVDGRGDQLQVAVTDFGLMRVIGPGAVLTRCYQSVAEALSISQFDRYPVPGIDTQKLGPLHNSFLQSFHFLAPEQKRVYRGVELTTAVDAFAFGVLAYYLLCGQFPEGWIDRPSVVASQYRRDWDSVVENCLKADPKARPEQLTALLHGSEQRILTPSTAPASPAPRVADLMQHVPTPPPAEKPAPAPEPLLAAAAATPIAAATTVSPDLKPRIQEGQLKTPEYDPDPAQALHVDSEVKRYQPAARAAENVEPIPTDMVVIPGGSFLRGSNDGNRDEMPRHEVHLNSFAIDVHPVTNEQYVRFLKVMDGEKDHNNNDLIKLKESRIRRSRGSFIIESGYNKHPVVGVSWYGAVAYARWVGKRLPTEAEWEVAALGGLGSVAYPTGESIEKSQANFFSSDSTPVMSYPPNGYGLYEMSGNVYDWCQDWYGYDYYYTSEQEPDDPTGPLQGVYRVLRGGCWKSLEEDLRCSHRHRNNPGTGNRTYGFRCATDVE